jgi:hypothetical protein
MTAENEQDEKAMEEEPEQEELIESPLKRTFMVIFSPKRVFESLFKSKRGRADWLIPAILTMIVSLVVINVGYEYIQDEQVAASIKTIQNNKNMTDEQKDARIEQTRQSLEKMAGVSLIITNASVVLGVFAGAAVIGLVLMVIARVFLSSPLPFRDGFTITALAMMVSTAGSIIQLPLMMLYESFTRSRFTLGLLLPSGMADSFLYKLVNIDLFVLLFTIFLGIGLAVFTKKKLSQALTPLVVLWLLYRVAAVSLTGLLSGIGS